MSDLRFREVRPGCFTTTPCEAPGCDQAGVARFPIPVRDGRTPRAAYACRTHAPARQSADAACPYCHTGCAKCEGTAQMPTLGNAETADD